MDCILSAQDRTDLTDGQADWRPAGRSACRGFDGLWAAHRVSAEESRVLDWRTRAGPLSLDVSWHRVRANAPSMGHASTGRATQPGLPRLGAAPAGVCEPRPRSCRLAAQGMARRRRWANRHWLPGGPWRACDAETLRGVWCAVTPRDRSPGCVRNAAPRAGIETKTVKHPLAFP